jgi:hypothetical protein
MYVGESNFVSFVLFWRIIFRAGTAALDLQCVIYSRLLDDLYFCPDVCWYLSWNYELKLVSFLCLSAAKNYWLDIAPFFYQGVTTEF